MISQENTCVGVSFLIKLQAEDLKLYYSSFLVFISCVWDTFLVDILLLLIDIFFMLLLLVVLPNSW